ncbi:hypothetical protein ACQPYK_26850 [Streptosporangium sp. CA-135522]|uniref:hypothetical protein n=1 Tax=Streptosporangium sp. CA-135522 TaxID=3240072 RepID=UPI003D8C1F41
MSPSSTHAPATGPVPTILSAMFVRAIAWWLEHDRPSPPRQIAARFAQLATAIIAEADSWTGSGRPTAFTL